MGQYTESIVQFLKYSFNVLPEMRRQADSISNRHSTCKSQIQSSATVMTKAAITNCSHTSMLCSSFFALYPGVDMKNTLTFILSLYSLSEILEAYRSKTGISDETEIRKLYNCLSGAVDPSRSKGCTLANLPEATVSLKNETASPLCLSDQCRLQLAVLPSLQLVAPKLKKYMQFYIDLQSYRHNQTKARSEYLNVWSDYYLKRYQEISCWEFCAAADSLLGIAAMYTFAFNPRLTPEDIRLLDEACFPWLCCLDSLLHAYICLRVSGHTENLNFASFYKNLKVCEERLLFFAAKAEEACMKLKENSFFISLIKIMTGMYLADSEASFGMYRLASSNILKNSSPQTVLYKNACRLLHLYRIF